MATTTREPRLLDELRGQLAEADDALLCVAFASRSGVHLLARQLERVRHARLLVTSVFGATTTAALTAADDLGVEVRILNPSGGTYHPKLYLTASGARAAATVGSANLTSGLVGNIEVAVRIEGSIGERGLADVWDIGEELWAHPGAEPWTPDLEVRRAVDELDAELLALLEAEVARDRVFRTLGRQQVNTVVAVEPSGVWVETERSRSRGQGPQHVPAWMLQLAWDHLRLHGELTNRYLLADDGLNVKRSSAVCALLARLPGVEAIGAPRIVLRRPPTDGAAPAGTNPSRAPQKGPIGGT